MCLPVAMEVHIKKVETKGLRRENSSKTERHVSYILVVNMI
jgi:hypothetical protein